ncbi:TldD/PmbA family protein [Candidatus Nucleicultrix amoebiphila]|jgi:PmbA protein|uniref:Modulator protein n=1 Tax=Candidatus Nucleicultrix amoebiphila FS5 TaxID=1414854 RepID=A0A1W6N3T0_9PROT|nr:TldD/PmbA family protein [Candidatus Nucleicultrix amoebiphila]ARN84503.1 hypothetical protein GQ61_03260 [Candidatus Nucleicultrix amoebiphila FS5]
MQENDFKQLIENALTEAMKKGIDAADVIAFHKNTVSVNVRNQALEKVKKASSIELGLRVFKGKRQALVSTTDTSFDSLVDMAQQAVDMVKHVPEDPYCGLAENFAKADQIPSIDLFDSTECSIDELIERAKTCEENARSIKGVTNIETSGTTFSTYLTGVANSHGFMNTYSQSSHQIFIGAIAGEGLDKQIEFDGTNRIYFNELEDPTALGKRVAEMAVKKLNPRKISSQKVPVVFHPRVGQNIINYFAESINGQKVCQAGLSYLQHEMNKLIFSPGITIVDDATRARGLASYPVDVEGVLPQKRLLVEKGVLKSWLLDTRSAMKMELKSTGHAVRTTRSTPSPTSSNLYLEPGQVSFEDLIKSIKNGFFVTDLLGHGFSSVTGDYSEGASGFWIENGQISYPVQQITIAGTFKEMLKNITVANDLKFNYATNTPTFVIEGMTLAGV